jgi:hypothetical protein
MIQIKGSMEALGQLVYTFTYDEITNTVNITSNDPTNTNTTFDFINSGCRRFLGFTAATQVIQSSNGITSDRAVDITDTMNSIYVRVPNLASQKVIESSSGRFENVLAHIPVTLSRNAFFTYEPSVPFSMELNQHTISYVQLSITFADGRAVNFQKADWEVNLELSFTERPKGEQGKRAGLDKRMMNRVSSHYNNKSKGLKQQKGLKALFRPVVNK